jgi:phosphatidylserine/phosphatidylglycerophosphate/cardiolipin synthase-like enzyme
LENGIDVRLDGNSHSMIIIDDHIVITGSCNFSKSARTRNDKNTLVIHYLEIGALYKEEFKWVWMTAQE